MRRTALALCSTLAAIGLAALMTACVVPPRTPASPAEPAPGTRPPQPTPDATSGPRASYAPTPRDYRRDAASHIYGLHAPRIYTGQLPPLLYAVGVLDVELDARGNVIAVNWRRAPRHAPEVMAEIERMVRAAAPYPTPVRLGRVTWTDTWLWDRSGQFQLDTLSEGQM